MTAGRFINRTCVQLLLVLVSALNGSAASAGLIAHYDFASKHTPHTSWHYEDISGNGHHGKELGSYYNLDGRAHAYADMWEYVGGTRGGVYSYTWNNEVDYDSSVGIDNGVLGTGAWDNNRLDINANARIPDLAANSGLTFALWVNPQDVFFDGVQRPHFGGRSTFAHLVALGTYGDAPIMSIELDDTRHVHGWVEGNGADTQYEITGTGTIPANKWTHIAITYDRAKNEAKTYINGELDSTTAIPGVGDGVLTWSYAKLGGALRTDEKDTFVGQMDDVRIYYDVLYESQIASISSVSRHPAVVTLAPTDIEATSATLRGEVTSLGTPPSDTHVWVYWGTIDSGTNGIAPYWGNATYMGTNALGIVSTNLTDLASDTRYYYRFAASNAAGKVWSPVGASTRPTPPGSFTIAVLPDTQSLSMSHPEVFKAQTQWIKDHRASMSHNIACVLQLGDISNNNTAGQWDNALAAMSILDGFVPYAMATGNHDYGPNGKTTNRETSFNDNAYFGPGSPYATQASAGGFYEPGRTDNSWHTFNAGGRDWIVLALEFGPRDAVIVWADQVLAAHPNHTGILITHAYMYSDETRYDSTLRGTTQTWSPEVYGTAASGGVNNGQEMWDNLVAKHNVALTLNGHVLYDGAGRLSSINPSRDHVTHQILQNYQGGSDTANTLGDNNGFMRLYEVQPDGKTIHIQTYSPTKDQYLTDPQNDFWIGLVDADGVKSNHTAAVSANLPIVQYQLEKLSATGTVANIGSLDSALNGSYAGSGLKASEYDGIDDKTTIGAFADLPAWSITAWVRANSDQDSQRIFANDLASRNDHVIFGITPEGSGVGTSHRWMLVHCDDTTSARTSVEGRDDVITNRWYHLAATADGESLRLYVDGNLVGSAERTGANLNFGGSAGAAIGSSINGSSAFNGTIAEFALFNKPLSLSELTGQRMSSFRRVVAGNLVNHSATDPGANPPATTSLNGHAYPGLELPGGNEGDTRVAIAGMRAINQREGVLLATVTQNQRDGIRGTVEVARNAFLDGYMSLSMTQAGFPGINEININTAVAWFPFAGGWTGAHVNNDGTLFEAHRLTNAAVTLLNTGRYRVALEGVDARTNGLLFTVGAANANNVVPTGVTTDGTWDIRVQNNASNFAATGESAPFSFVYIPYDTPGLIGGRYDGFTGTHFNSTGTFNMTKLGRGQYQLAIENESPQTGMLLLTVSYERLDTFLAPDDKILTYEKDDSGRFIINSFDLPDLTAQDTQFAWAFISFSPGQKIPARQNGLLCLIR